MFLHETKPKGAIMIWTIAVVLLVLWMLGVGRVIQGRRVV
jgi:hypothetical protein